MSAPLTGRYGRQRALPAATDSAHEVLSRLLEILAPGGADLVAFLECYFDESGSHAGSPVLCVAGYLFDKDQCRALDLKWKAVLERYQLPYFRMSACAHNRHPLPVEPFGHLAPEECIEVEKEMIRLINDHALLGLSVAINENDYFALFGRNSPGGAPYSFCCWQILAGIRSWTTRNEFEGKISYFFESGHASQPEANALMKRIFDDPALRSEYHYASHSFVDKKCVRPVQSADILAWQTATQVKRWLKQDPRMRADYEALCSKPQHEIFIGNRKTLGPVVAYHRSLQGLPVDGITGHYGRHWFWSSYDGQDHQVI